MSAVQSTALPPETARIRLASVPASAGATLAVLAHDPANPVHAAVRAHTSVPPADALAPTLDAEAIRALLDDGAAQIREATLDAMMPGAPPARPPLCDLASRARLEGTGPQPESQEMADAAAMQRRGTLDEAALLEAARQGQAVRAGARLAAAAGVPYAAVDRAVDLRSARALVSLVWQAGFSMAAALVLQAALAELGPGQLLEPGPSGVFPLSPAEMRFQLGLLTREA